MTSGRDTVVVMKNLGEWHVLIQEKGIEHCQSFVQEDWAMNYARGQRIRLGLPRDLPATAAS